MGFCSLSPSRYVAESPCCVAVRGSCICFVSMFGNEVAFPDLALRNCCSYTYFMYLTLFDFGVVCFVFVVMEVV